MAFAPTTKDKSVSVDVFGGLATLQAPQSLPNGVSPDNSDCQFTPGSVFSRAALKKFLATPLGNVALNYGKTYIDPTGIIRNFYLTSDGNFWMQIVAPSNLAAVPTVLFTTTPGSRARSCTAYGREYVAISDGFHGTEAPIQITGLSDGTVQIDRVTHDAPGASPSISNLIIPPVTISDSATPLTLAVYEIDPENEVLPPGYFTSFNLYTATSIVGLSVGNYLTITGTTNFNGTFGPITAILPGSPYNLIQVAAYIPAGTPFETPVSATAVVPQDALVRSSGVVTGIANSPHQMQPGYQVQISNALAADVGTGIASIIIDNEDSPGIATVEVNLASGSNNHGLVPGLSVSITGVLPVGAGGTISSIVRAGQVVTVVMSEGTGLTPGAIITVDTGGTFDGIQQVVNVSTTTNTGDTFTYLQVDVDLVGPSGGTVSINWPIPNTPTPTFFEVIGVPSATSFQIALNYADSPAGGWTTGNVTYAWDGTFFVQAVFDPYTPGGTDYLGFTYQQYGPDATASPTGGNQIIATPVGQSAPGQRQMVVFFQDRQGGITAISPPVNFVANGGQYLSAANLPIGPPGTVARGVAFTGAQGAFFYYIPSTPQINGQIVGTATLISDNTTTAAIFDFSDTTLFEATGISEQGNNLANQIVIDGALGFGYYASRLMTWGQRSYIQPGGGAGGLLNMGFDGGYLANATTLPLGWDISENVGGALANGHFGQVWNISVAPSAARGKLSQSMYQTVIGSPIATGSTLYRLRGWFLLSGAAADLTFTVTISSASTSFISTAMISGAAMPAGATGAYLEAVFSAQMPTAIPADLVLTISAASTATTVTLAVDDLFLMYAETPYFLDIYGSYAENQTGFDGVSGVFGPVNDTHAVTDIAVRQDELALLTKDPGGRLHVTSDNGVTEPSGWTVDERDTECGTLSSFSVTRSQADDSTSSGGEEWFAWCSASGLRIYGGGPVWKISQEIQPNWSGLSSANDSTRSFPGINPAAAATIWAVNEPGQMGKPDTGRVIYIGLPLGAATSPSAIYQMDYKELDTAEQIATADPVRIGFGGKLIATDHSRKWSPWNLAMNGAALLYTGANSVQLAFFAGVPAVGGPYGNVYTMDATKLTDDDYGQIYPYYTIYFSPSNLEEQGLQLGSARKQHVYTSAFVSGVGIVTLAPMCDTLANPWPLVVSRTLGTSPKFDLEGPGTALAQRIAIRISTSPAQGTDNGFVLSKLVLWMRQASHMPVRGAAR